MLMLLFSASLAYSAPAQVVGTKTDLVKALLLEYDSCTHVDSISSEVLGNVIQYVCMRDDVIQSLVDLQYFNESGAMWKLSK